MSDVVKGYKVFNPDWTCRGKQYACPGKFEEDVELSVCGRGMDFVVVWLIVSNIMTLIQTIKRLKLWLMVRL